MPDFGSLFDNPAFTSGLSLLGGARERNPWMAAQQQMQQWQSLQQQGKYKKMQEQLLQIEADKAKQAAEQRQRAQAFAQSYDPNAPMNDQLKLGVQSGAVDASTAIMAQQKQAEAAAAVKVKLIDDAIAREDNQAAKKELQDERLKVEERMKFDTLANQRLIAQMTAGIGQGNRAILNELRQTQIDKNKQDITKQQKEMDSGKPLPTPAVNSLAAVGTAMENSRRFRDTFKDEYAGKTFMGDWDNTQKRIFGDNTGQAQWWQDFGLDEATKRHTLFGSALTQTEAPAWEKLTITPRMHPPQVRKNLERRAVLEARAAEKLSKAYKAGGYNPTQIDELTQVSPAVSGAAPAAPGGIKFLGFE